MKALITSGGRGTRLRPLTHTQNKHLIPIANKPIIHYAIEYCAQAGIREIGIVYNAESTAIPDALGDGSKFGVHFTFIPQEKPLGLAHVVKISQDFIGEEPFVFYLGDNMVVGGLKRFIDEFEKNQSNCHLTLARVKDPQRFGVPELDGNRIVRIEEKPAKPKSNFAVAGIYIYDASIFEAVNAIKPSARGELEISDAHQYLLEHGYKVTYSEITGWWKDTGKPYDLLEANRLVLENLQERIAGQVDEKSLVTGKVVLEEGATIVNSIVRGPAVIGKHTRIENSYIGPFTSIYNQCLIQNSEVEFSILLEKCKLIDVTIRVEHSLLGNEAEIVKTAGRPATNRFLIGDQSRIELL